MKKLESFRTTIAGCFALVTWIAPSAWAQPTVQFVNGSLITINTPRFPEDDGSVMPLVATPYPSTITVSGFAAKETIAKITVTLHDLSHETPEDIDILLVGPEGQNIVLFSDAGGGLFGGGGGLPDPDVIVTVTLDDDAADSLPLPVDGPLVSGTFKPSNYEQEDDDDPDVFPDQDEDGFPTPHPEPSSATTLSVFAGTHPNGDWRLYVVDDEIDDAGKIAKGWSLTISSGTRSAPFRRGDANADGAVGITDAVVTLNALFRGAPWPACADAADADDDGSVSLTDAVYTLRYLFLSGSVPPAPGPSECGADPTEDALTCDSFLSCRSDCFGGQLDCNGVCREVALDPSNCGACGVVCPPGTNCAGGSCQPAEPCEGCGF
jgi:subtilisin-like proprotein convertase family protein